MGYRLKKKKKIDKEKQEKDYKTTEGLSMRLNSNCIEQIEIDKPRLFQSARFTTSEIYVCGIGGNNLPDMHCKSQGGVSFRCEVCLMSQRNSFPQVSLHALTSNANLRVSSRKFPFGKMSPKKFFEKTNRKEIEFLRIFKHKTPAGSLSSTQ